MPLFRSAAAAQRLGLPTVVVDREKIRAMSVEGESVRSIATTMRVSKSLVANVLKEQARSVHV
jgi:hypothetical protein